MHAQGGSHKENSFVGKFIIARKGKFAFPNEALTGVWFEITK